MRIDGHDARVLNFLHVVSPTLIRSSEQCRVEKTAPRPSPSRRGFFSPARAASKDICRATSTKRAGPKIGWTCFARTGRSIPHRRSDDPRHKELPRNRNEILAGGVARCASECFLPGLVPRAKQTARSADTVSWSLHQSLQHSRRLPTALAYRPRQG